ncbi:hypothetical protein BGZ94_008414 [Podila epigama]|nr:hypothetical protein BGZ94_008414 [Podila epigama]
MTPLTRISTLCLAVISLATIATAAYDCTDIKIESNTYNLGALKPIAYTVTGEKVVVRPATIREDYHINPCQALIIPEGKENESCLKDTWVCRDTKRIDGDKVETLFLEPIAGSAPATDKTPARNVEPLATKADKLQDIKDLPWTLTLHGGVDRNQNNQSAVITFICDRSVTDVNALPTLTSSADGVVKFNWKTVHACPVHTELETAPGMSSFGIFMTALFIFGLIYLILGALYNHQVYGAKGLDLLPNLDFWRDFPGLVADVARHVWDSATGRATNSRGYVSV